mgnify:CR=1 FL=1
MKIAILVKEFPPNVIGGTETQSRRMAAELQRRTDHKVTVYTKAYPGEEQINSEFDLVRIPNWRISPFISTLTFILMAFLYLFRDRHQYNVLQCMMVYPNGFVGYLLHRLSGLPYFAWIRGGDFYLMKDTGWKRWMINKVLSDTEVFVQTEHIKRDVQSEFPLSNLTVLGNGVTIPAETADGDAIVYVGRLKEQKGVHVLLRALDKLEHDEKVLIVGEGPEKDRLEGLAEQLDVDVEFVGEVPPGAVDSYLRKGKMLVLPSIRGEGLPNAILEAMAMGLPVVATEVAGIPDIISNGENGFTAPPNDAEALAEQIQLLSEDEQKRRQMGQTAREYVIENHSWEQIIDELEKVYEKLANS